MLGANQTQTYTYRWDTSGEVGDVTLHAHAYSYMDVRSQDNERSMRVPILASPVAGVSASPLARNPACPVGPW